jgi:hypothetical protein
MLPRPVDWRSPPPGFAQSGFRSPVSLLQSCTSMAADRDTLVPASSASCQRKTQQLGAAVRAYELVHRQGTF